MSAPAHKAFFAALCEVAPARVPFAAALARARYLLREGGSGETLPAQPLAEGLARLFAADQCDLLLAGDGAWLDLAPEPAPSALMRYQARTGHRVTNRWHEPVTLEEADRLWVAGEAPSPGRPHWSARASPFRAAFSNLFWDAVGVAEDHFKKMAQFKLNALMQHRPRIGLADERGIEIEEVIQPLRRLGFVDLPGHDEVAGVVVAFALHEAGVEIGERRVEIADAVGQDLEFLAASSLDEAREPRDDR